MTINKFNIESIGSDTIFNEKLKNIQNFFKEIDEELRNIYDCKKDIQNLENQSYDSYYSQQSQLQKTKDQSNPFMKHQETLNSNSQKSLLVNDNRENHFTFINDLQQSQHMNGQYRQMVSNQSMNKFGQSKDNIDNYQINNLEQYCSAENEAFPYVQTYPSDFPSNLQSNTYSQPLFINENMKQTNLNKWK